MRMTVGMLRRIIREEVVRSVLRENAEPMSPEESKSWHERAKDVFKTESANIVSILSDPGLSKARRIWASAEWKREYKAPSNTDADSVKEMLRGHQWILFVRIYFDSVVSQYWQVKDAPEDQQQALKKKLRDSLTKDGEFVLNIVKEFEAFQKNIEMLDVLPSGASKFEDADAITGYKNSILDSVQVLADLYEEIRDQLQLVAAGLDEPEYRDQRRRERMENRFRSRSRRIRG